MLMKKSTRPLSVLVVLLLLLFGLPVQAKDAYGPIRRGENLWGIAREVYPDQGVTRDQVMLALLRANPQAFRSPCNANAPLRTGVVLQVPPLSEVRALSPADARREFRRQVREWKDHLRTGRPLVCPPASRPTPAKTPVQPPPPPKTATPPKQPPSPAPFPPAPAVTKPPIPEWR
jgi:FimV-like protein